MQNYVQHGRAVTITAAAAILSGQLVLVGNLYGVAANSVAPGATVEIDTEGVFDLAKGTATFAPGAYVYWNATSGLCTATNTDTKIGVAVTTNPDGTLALGGNSGDATVRVRLNPAF